jgi:hypothetical protein
MNYMHNTAWVDLPGAVKPSGVALAFFLLALALFFEPFILISFDGLNFVQCTSGK